MDLELREKGCLCMGNAEVRQVGTARQFNKDLASRRQSLERDTTPSRWGLVNPVKAGEATLDGGSTPESLKVAFHSA